MDFLLRFQNGGQGEMCNHVGAFRPSAVMD